MEIEKYCSKCGSKMQRKSLHIEDVSWLARWWFKFWGYNKFNRHTGEEVLIYEYECPRWSWFNKGHDSVQTTKYFT